jgi:hypothetical protein
MKSINILCGRNAELHNVNIRGIHIYHCLCKGSDLVIFLFLYSGIGLRFFPPSRSMGSGTSETKSRDGTEWGRSNVSWFSSHQCAVLDLRSGQVLLHKLFRSIGNKSKATALSILV